MTMRTLSLPLLAVLALLTVAVPAQTVRLSNYSPARFAGWKRTTIDSKPPFAAGKLDDAHYVLGRAVGVDTHVVDVWCDLEPGETETHDLSTSTADAWRLAPMPRNPAAWFGGPVAIDGQPMRFVALREDGASYLLHMRARTGRTFNVDLWLSWYPDQPGWAFGEVVITCSNPTVPDLRETSTGPVLTFGDALVWRPGAGLGRLVAKDTTFTDGQARAFPVVLIWTRHLKRASDWSSVGAVADCGIGAVGIGKLLADGNPSYPADYSGRIWAATRFAEAARRLHTWEGGVCGPATASTVTGAQEDQVFVRGEPLLPGAVGAEWVVYFSALKLANRPCHHLIADGSQWDLASHVGPRAIMWDGRFHWHTGVSPYQGGKPRQPTSEELTYDGVTWFGPDVEHWLCNTAAAGARYTGSPALQWLLEQQARIYFAQYTTTPGWSTSGVNASRAVGWEGIMAVHLWRELEDRALAHRVREHWRKRATDVLIPTLSGYEDWWDARIGDHRLWDAGMTESDEPWVMPWQQSIGAYGLDLACAELGPEEGRAVALEAALVCVQRDWVKLPGETRYRNIGNQPWSERAAGFYTPAFFDARPRWFETSWGVPAIAVVLRHQPEHERARALWAQASNDAAQGSQSWFPPGVRDGQ